MQLASPSVVDVVLWGAGIGIPSLLGLGYRQLVSKLKSIDTKQDEQTKKMERWEVHFFGLNGDNGLSGDIRQLKAAVFGERRSGVDRRRDEKAV